MTKLRLFFWLFFPVSLLFSAGVALADTGPKPTMEFTLHYDATATPGTITSATLYECKQENCSDAAPLAELGPQRLTCDVQSCHALAYGFAPYHKLRIQFSDGKSRESNIFATAGFNAKYRVTVRSDDLLVEAQTSVFPRLTVILLFCLCLLVASAVVIGFIVFFLRRRPKS